MKVLAKTMGMSREEWLGARRLGIGGSDISAILGHNRWRGPVEVYLDKVAPYETEETEAMHWGTVLEDVIAQEFALRTGFRVRRRNAILQSKAHPCLIANIDREIIGASEGLECKTASAFKQAEWEADEVPTEYLLQCQHYMAVTGYDAWWIAVLIGGNTFVYKRIDRDEDIIEILTQRAEAFWNDHVVPKVMPEIMPAAAETLARLFPQSNGEVLQLPSAMDELVIKRNALKAAMKGLEMDIAEVENQIKHAIGNAEAGETLNWRVKWPSREVRRIDTKRLRAEMPEIAEQYTNTNIERRLTVSQIKED